MEFDTFNLIILAVILLSTKLLGLISRRINMPQVVGALIAGIILGPSCLNIVEENSLIKFMSEIGVILLMFSAGLETDLEELKKTGAASFIVAVIGVIVPLLGGTFTYILFFDIDVSNYQHFLESLFIGVVLTATSVSITVETLRELGKLKGRVGTTILGAAIIDDIAGIIVLTIVTSLKDTSVNPAGVFAKIILYFVSVAILALLIKMLKPIIESQDRKRRTPITSLALCFIIAYVSEEFFGIADITGAYFCGLMICNIKISDYVEQKINIMSYMLFAPIFFASIGFETNLSGITGNIIVFSIILMVVAILTKIIGCGLGARICRFSNNEALSIGVGMISRGEVALIVAQKGANVGLISPKMFPAIVLVVVVTTLITPILLKIVMAEKGNEVTE